MQNKTIENWKIIAVSGAGVCVIGLVDGKELQTTVVTGSSGKNIRTESGSVYELGNKNPGLWEVQLQMKRPEQFKNLQKNKTL